MDKPKPTPEEIKAQLDQYSGTETYYKTLDKRLFFTDGVKAMADLCQAYWLIDLIASHQPQARRNQRLVEHQAWKLERTEGSGALAYCCEDTPSPELARISQKIEYTDFPLPEIQLWVCQNSPTDWVLMLPSEY